MLPDGCFEVKTCQVQLVVTPQLPQVESHVWEFYRLQLNQEHFQAASQVLKNSHLPQTTWKAFISDVWFPQPEKLAVMRWVLTDGDVSQVQVQQSSAQQMPDDFEHVNLRVSPLSALW